MADWPVDEMVISTVIKNLMFFKLSSLLRIEDKAESLFNAADGVEIKDYGLS